MRTCSSDCVLVALMMPGRSTAVLNRKAVQAISCMLVFVKLGLKKCVHDC